MAENPALKDIDFSRLRFPVHTVPHGTDLLLKFPELQAYQEFAEYKETDRNEVIRYVIYMYDMNSGLVQKFTDLKQRKEAALDIAGFERNSNTGKFKKEVYRMINLEKILVKENPEEEDSKTVAESNRIFDMAMRYIIEQNNRIWSMKVSNEHAFDEYLRIIMEPVADRKDKDLLTAAKMKDDLMVICDTINTRLIGYDKLLFGDNDEVKEKAKVRRITPETIHKHAV